MAATEQSVSRRFFPLEGLTALAVIVFGVSNVFVGFTGLHCVVAFYLLVLGLFLAAVAIRRRQGPPKVLPDDTNGLVKAIEKLAEPKPFGFVCLAISPLAMGYGGLGVLVFLLLYLSGVNAMRLSDEELMAWIGAPPGTVLVSPRAGTVDGAIVSSRVAGVEITSKTSS